MALLGNYSVLYKTPGYWRSGGATGQGLDRSNFNGSGPSRNRFTSSAIPAATAHPLGTLPGNAIVIPQKSGGIGSRNNVTGFGDATGSGALGVNLLAAIDGLGDLAGIGQLVVSAASALSGSGQLSGNVLAALSAAASLAGQGDMAGTAQALAWAVAAMQGQAAANATPYATGTLAASIDVAAVGELSPGSIADEILDQQMVETGLSVRETLRLCAAALAGKISGADGTTISIRNAVADDTARIVATVDANGNRTAVTYDLD